jgi:hypothetical protein
MKRLIVVLVVIGLLVAAIPAVTVFAKAAARNPLELANAYCPIDGNRVGITSPFIKLGKGRVGFCSEQCKQRFMARTAVENKNIRY